MIPRETLLEYSLVCIRGLLEDPVSHEDPKCCLAYIALIVQGMIGDTVGIPPSLRRGVERVMETFSLPIPEILGLEFDCADLGQRMTIHGYLLALLTKLWEEDEGFSGKRPFGNSGWKYDLYTPLVAEGVVGGTLTDLGNIDTCDTERADRVILACIASLGTAP